jgi:hypothetical protein
MSTVGMAAGLSALIQFLAFPFVVAWKLALRRPARVEAIPLDEPSAARTWRVSGFGAGRRAVKTVAARIREGREPALPE